MVEELKWKKLELPESDENYGYYLENDDEKAEVIRKDWHQWEVYLKKDDKVISKHKIDESFKEGYSNIHASIKKARAFAKSWITR